jgi:amidase
LTLHSDARAVPDRLAADICFKGARALSSLIHGRQLSAREVMAAHLAQIGRSNPTLNAIVAKLDDERCLALAGEADERIERGGTIGPLHGLPVAFKDLQPAVGFPFTRGSPIFKDFFPAADSIVVERLKRAGAIPIGKTNVPEFGMGSHTYNAVYGTTVNAYDHSKSAGGSSGGAAAALAAGMLPIADGSDLGGSLRNPASFNNIVALRPSVGLVPVAPEGLPGPHFGVTGPMGRSVADVAFLLSVMAGPDPRDPSCVVSNPSLFAETLDRDWHGVRVAWCPDLGGLPLDQRVRAIIEGRRRVFEDLGCIVEDACPDLADADEIFLTLRAWRSAALYGALLPAHAHRMKPEAIWEIELGQSLAGADVDRAAARHVRLLERVRRFQARYQFLVSTVSQVPPFAATLDWPRVVDGVRMDSYIAWMKSCYWISVTNCPAVSVPAGFTTDGLPVGLQIVGRHLADFELLQLANMVAGVS